MPLGLSGGIAGDIAQNYWRLKMENMTAGIFPDVTDESGETLLLCFMVGNRITSELPLSREELESIRDTLNNYLN